MKRNSIMQVDRNDQTYVRHAISGMPTAVVALADADADAATVASTASATPSTLTDAQLYRQCKYYGKQVKGWMRKFESLLPEVYRRRLYKRRGFSGIHEFAQKLAGMSRDKVDRILRLSKKIEDKPALKQAFESGELGYTKIDEIAFVATAETETMWIRKAKSLSHIALRREIACARSGDNEIDSSENLALFTDVGNFEPEKMTVFPLPCGVSNVLLGESIDKSAGKSAIVSFNANPETERKLRALQHELEKARGEKLSLGETIEILINREHKELIEKAQRKKTANYCPDCVKKRADEVAQKSEVARAVPAEIRHTVLARQNYRCVGVNSDFGRCGDTDGSVRGYSDAGHTVDWRVDGCPDAVRAGDGRRDGGSDAVREVCTHPPTELHHLDGWALTKNHDPDRMRYLCKKHHAEVHADDGRVQAYRSG